MTKNILKKKLHTIKLQAGALQYTIFISVVIALLVFSFISLTYVQEKLRIKASMFEETVQYTDLGFQYLAQRDVPFITQTPLVFDKETSTETVALKKHWGIFDVASITSARANESFTKMALVGGNQQEKTAVYLVDEHQPLVLVGNSRIEGKTYLPEQGIKAGSIAGHSYNASQLVYGTILRSANQLPKIKNFNFIKKVKDDLLTNESNSSIELQEQGKVINGFDQATKVVSNQGPVNLQFVELIGNIIIYSDAKITVYPSAKLQDVILIAPKIEVIANTNGNFQAFAQEEINIGKNCKLNYPTALVLNEGNAPIETNTHIEEPRHRQIFINKSSDIRGIVFFLSEKASKTPNYKSQIILEEDVVVRGEVYCQQNIELKGTILGSVYTKGFIANQFGSIYKNHIYNGKILSNDLPNSYSGLQFNDTKLTVAKWLNY